MAVALNTETWGNGERGRILLLHGITSSLAGWWRLAPDLADLGWQVTAVDLRGHGDSPDPGSYLFEEHVEDVVALGSGWDAVLGHSMGGTISVLVADRQPGWSAGLLLQDPALMLPEPQQQILDWLLEEYLVDADPVRIAKQSPRWDRRDVAAKVEALMKSTTEMVVDTVESNWPWMVLDEAKGLEVPTIVVGSDPEVGGIVPITIGEWLAESAWIEFEWIRGTSHSAHRDSDLYGRYLDVVTSALDRLPTLGSS